MKQILSNNTVTKQFSYSREKVALNFSLRIDIKNDLKCFKELLEAALIDVSDELKKHA